MVQIQQLIYFQKTAHTKSMNKASEQLFMSQSSLSKAIKNLESELNIVLFDRNNKGVQLTAAGKKLLLYVNTITRQLELIDHIAEGRKSKNLYISAYPFITMSYFIKKFYETNNKDSIDIMLNEVRLEKILSDIIDFVSEIGFIQYNELQEKELLRRLSSKNLEFNKLGVDTWYANVGPNSPLHTKNIVTMEELIKFPILRAKDDFFSSMTYYLEIDGYLLTEFTKTIFVNNGATMVKLLLDTDGFRFGPGASTEDYRKFGIKTIPIKNCTVKITQGWIKRKGDDLSEEAASFIRIMEDYFNETRLTGTHQN